MPNGVTVVLLWVVLWVCRLQLVPFALSGAWPHASPFRRWKLLEGIAPIEPIGSINGATAVCEWGCHAHIAACWLPRSVSMAKCSGSGQTEDDGRPLRGSIQVLRCARPVLGLSPLASAPLVDWKGPRCDRIRWFVCSQASAGSS